MSTINKGINLTNFFKDEPHNGKICFSKQWLEFIETLSPEKLLELRIFFMCASEGVPYTGGKKSYTKRTSGQKVRYFNVTPDSGVKQTVIVPEFPGFDEFICQMHLGKIEISLEEITEHAQKLEELANKEHESKVVQNQNEDAPKPSKSTKVKNFN